MFDFAFEAMAKAIPPAKRFALLNHWVEDSVKHKVSKYDVKFDALNRKVSFVIYDERYEGGQKEYPFKKGEKFVDIGINFVRAKIPKNSEIHLALIKIEPGNIQGFLFFAENGEKKSITYKF